MKKIFTLIAFFGGLVSVFAQNGEIAGKVVDENGEGIPLANVVIVDNKGVSTGRGTSTDFDGNYSIKPLTPGKYNVQFSYVSYATQIQQGVVVNADKMTPIDVKLKPAATELGVVEIIDFKVPLIDPGNTSSKNTITAEEIANMPTRNVSDIAATTAGAFQSDQGGGINIKGGREDGTEYYIDGVKVTGVPTLPATAIEQLQVITGGVPARYGDLTGGIVNITTKGPAGQFNGGIEAQTSQGLDAYGYNLVNGNLTGPIWKKKNSRKTILGFFAAFEYLRQQDPDPSAVGVWQVKKSVLDSLRQFPLQKKATEQGFNLSAENITYKDMFNQKAKPNVVENNFRGTGRIDIRPADNFTLSFGGSVSYRKYHDWVEQYTLFNSENNPLFTELNWRVYGRFTHSIQAKQSDDEGEGKKKKSSAFQNAFYSVQVDYEKYSRKYEDDTHGFNTFDYGYIGKFQTMKTPNFTYGDFTDTLSGGDVRTYTGWIQDRYSDTAVIFTPGTINPYGTRFTQQYYELLDAQVSEGGRYQVFGANNAQFTSTLDQIQGNQALINGQRSNFVNSVWYNTGRQYNGYGYDNAGLGGGDNDQYRVRLEGSFDILKPGAPTRNKHSFEFGVEFEQRIQRMYSVSPLVLWQRARQLANAHLTTDDKANPIFRINGVNYSAEDPNRPPFYLTDTILFNRYYDASSQRYFDKSLRTSLGLAEDNTDFIDVFSLDPGQLNINMFSPEELLNDGAATRVNYRGYDPYGNRLTTQPSFDAYFTDTLANGEGVRAVPAFRPIYAAAYVSDRFYFKDLTFNVGLRIDRYDANQKVLKDEYSLYPIMTKGELAGMVHPSNIGNDFYVYADDAKSPSRVAGYRDGNVWYDRYGRELKSGKTVALASKTGSVQPWLKLPNQEIKDPSRFDPSQSFEDYKPTILVMPRLQFSFNITDQALFFAHYDILAQRPNSRGIMDPADYLFFQDNIGGALNNPNLKPERTIDFAFGFKQRVGPTAAFTVSAFYREFRDMIQIKKVIDAYPKDYLTFGNVDFGTTKGFSLDFELRRTANFSMKANYTMQFAEGTGSDDISQANLVNSNQPNFRSINPLSYDSRHMMNVNVSYSFASGKDYNGPTIKNYQVLSDAGINLQMMARSGTPYTAQANTTPNGFLTGEGRALTQGSINGSRLPWYFRLNLRVWKDFAFKVGKKEQGDDRREIAFQIYLQIQNLVGTKNVVNVYRYSGTPDDNGFLSDPSNAAAIQSYLNPQAFRDQYSAYINRGNNYSLPRRIFLGAIFSF